jgi:hypothetical protein
MEVHMTKDAPEENLALGGLKYAQVLHRADEFQHKRSFEHLMRSKPR